MLQQKLQNKNIILASQSPRRQELIKGLEVAYKIELKPVDEKYEVTLKREEITNYLSKLKATPFSDLKVEDIVITSDTIVWFKDKPLEKPKDKEAAFQMLKSLSGNFHEVVTSVCLTSKEKQEVDFNVTKVFFKELTTEEIEFYINNFSPLDKAGSYGIQEWFGYIAVERIEGSYFNVMGLPTHLLYKMLNNFV